MSETTTSSTTGQRKVVLERDYTRGLTPKFATTYPAEELGDRISEDDFSRVVNTINTILEEAETIRFSTVVEGCCSYCSCFLTPLCIPTQYERSLKRLERYIHEQNDTAFDYGLEWLNPITNGLLHLDILLKQTGSRISRAPINISTTTIETAEKKPESTLTTPSLSSTSGNFGIPLVGTTGYQSPQNQ